MNPESTQNLMVITTGYFLFRVPVDDALKAWLAVAQGSIAQERGCIDYRYSVDFFDPNRVSVAAHWSDLAVLDAYIHNAHTSDLVESLKVAGMHEFQ